MRPSFCIVLSGSPTKSQKKKNTSVSPAQPKTEDCELLFMCSGAHRRKEKLKNASNLSVLASKLIFNSNAYTRQTTIKNDCVVRFSSNYGITCRLPLGVWLVLLTVLAARPSSIPIVIYEFHSERIKFCVKNATTRLITLLCWLAVVGRVSTTNGFSIESHTSERINKAFKHFFFSSFSSHPIDVLNPFIKCAAFLFR